MANYYNTERAGECYRDSSEEGNDYERGCAFRKLSENSIYAEKLRDRARIDREKK